MAITIKIHNLYGSDFFNIEIIDKNIINTKIIDNKLWEIKKEYGSCIAASRDILSYTPIHNPENPYMKEMISKNLKVFLSKTKNEGFVIYDYISTFARDLKVSECYIHNLLQM